jgi:hypothetical protein
VDRPSNGPLGVVDRHRNVLVATGQKDRARGEMQRRGAARGGACLAYGRGTMMSRVFPVLAVLLPLVGCSAAPDDNTTGGDTGDNEEAITAGTCDRAKILASVGGARKTVITRGLHWFDSHVPYSQTHSFEGYRTDCSGFVSMTWQLNQSFTTADFYSGGAGDSTLSSYDALVPGDALVHRANGEGHIVLFVGWKDSAHSAACVIEQANTAEDMQFRARVTSSLHSSAYHPIRSHKLPSTAGAPPPDPPPDPGTPPDDGSGDTGSTGGDTGGGGGGGGPSCTSDGQCNPGNDGSGLICVGGQCVPGCHQNNQCPGVTRCISGQCR